MGRKVSLSNCIPGAGPPPFSLGPSPLLSPPGCLPVLSPLWVESGFWPSFLSFLSFFGPVRGQGFPFFAEKFSTAVQTSSAKALPFFARTLSRKAASSK